MTEPTDTTTPNNRTRFWPASPETKDVDMPTPEQARQSLLLLILPGGFEDLVRLTGGFEEAVAAALQAVAGELLRTFDRLEEEVSRP